MLRGAQDTSTALSCSWVTDARSGSAKGPPSPTLSQTRGSGARSRGSTPSQYSVNGLRKGLLRIPRREANIHMMLVHGNNVRSNTR
eukprot:969716-Pelagomonas_calceolata.AAC.2